jgi:hypothetical protein
VDSGDASVTELQPAVEFADLCPGLPSELATHVDVAKELLKMRTHVISRNLKQAAEVGNAMSTRFGVRITD